MSITITPTNAEITNNIDDVLNFCLDDIHLQVASATIKFMRIKYSIVFNGFTETMETLHAVYNDLVKINIAKPIQPYIYLSEENIKAFFADFKLDIAPADVAFTLEALDEEYEILEIYTMSAKFHAGKSNAIPADGVVIERSLNYNTVLPLAFRFPGQNVDYKFKGNTKTLDKQALSSALNVLQILFFQKYHFADASKNGGGFSPGFSSGFATTLALANADPFYQYEEGLFNEVISTYSVFGINYPIEAEAQNVFWLDENNIFHGMPLSGSIEGDLEYIHLMNPFSVDFKERKAGSISTPTMKINTGWKLASEVNLIDSLHRSQRAWLFKNDIADRVEVVCIGKKLKNIDSNRELLDHQLEFELNEQ